MKLNATLRKTFHERTNDRVELTANWDGTRRRHFLKGLGGATMVLPFLPSLVSERQARAQAAAKQKNFIGIAMDHGIGELYNGSTQTAQTSPSVYMPAFVNMTATQPAGAPFQIHTKSLTQAKADEGGKISQGFDAAFNGLTDKMLMLQGFDWYPIPWNHHSGFFGNINAAALGADYAKARPPQASIDQVMATSTNFYKTQAVLGRSLHWSGNWRDRGYECSFGFADPTNRTTSSIVAKGFATDPQVVWDTFLSGVTAQPQTPTGPTFEQALIDQVLTDYRSFKASPRLGSADRQIVDRHITLLTDTQNGLKSLSTALSCGDALSARPGAAGDSGTFGYALRKQMLASMNDVIVSVIACGACHSFVGRFMSMLSDDPEQWHAWAHAGAPEHRQQVNAILHDVVLDLALKLDKAGLLDDSLIMIPEEHSKFGHESWGIGIVTIGSAGGALKTGQYIDYRNWATGSDEAATGRTRTGLPMPQALATMLQAVGVPASEYQTLNRDSGSINMTGYGSTYPMSDPADNRWPGIAAAFKSSDLNAWLPLVKA